MSRVAESTGLQRHDDGRRCHRPATANPDQLQLLQSGGVQAVWTVEPWVTRLEREANARVLFEESDVITTWLVSSAKFLKENRDMATKIAAANVELTQWIQANEAEAQRLLIAELKEEMRSDFAPEAVAQAWKRIKFTPEVSRDLVNKASRTRRSPVSRKDPQTFQS